MNRWLLIRRMRGPAFLVLFGILALLNQWGVVSLRRSWPLCLIALGLILLAERVALLAGFPPYGADDMQPYPAAAPPSSAGQSLAHKADRSSSDEEGRT
ncbi:MAG TPA: DUF5668 domain-containing protein [Acidobacteriaceae bacterium]|jgi:hypothetical protein|nr:DUF5668 domain-containing protein [Acidobacteriaceae bacterium]